MKSLAQGHTAREGRSQGIAPMPDELQLCQEAKSHSGASVGLG